jgi:hypothetical protein
MLVRRKQYSSASSLVFVQSELNILEKSKSRFELYFDFLFLNGLESVFKFKVSLLRFLWYFLDKNKSKSRVFFYYLKTLKPNFSIPRCSWNLVWLMTQVICLSK